MKAGDLTATVGKYLATAHQSADDLIEIFGWFSLTENLHIAGVGSTDSSQPLIDRCDDKARFESRGATEGRLGGDDRNDLSEARFADAGTTLAEFGLPPHRRSKSISSSRPQPLAVPA
jgi:hypothetical protein